MAASRGSNSDEIDIVTTNPFKLAAVTIQKGGKTSRRVCENLYVKFSVDYIPESSSMDVLTAMVTIVKDDDSEVFSSRFSATDMKIESERCIKVTLRKGDASYISLSFASGGHGAYKSDAVAQDIYRALSSMDRVRVTLPGEGCVRSILKKGSQLSLPKKSVSFNTSPCFI